MTHYANEALPAKFGKINNKDLFTERMREWAKDITTHDE
jgi:hemerythrin superfamily protein